MHVFITGASGLIGSYTTQYLLDRGHSVTACDIVPLPDRIKLPEGSVFEIVDVTDFVAVEKAMLRIPCDGVIHLGAIPNPHTGADVRTTHNVNVVGSYNVLRTAADQGIKRIVQASSINAVGLLFTHDSRRVIDELPLTEESPRRPEDPYSLSKVICEIQADSLCRLYDDLRITSLRFHHFCEPELAVSRARHEDFWSWLSRDAAASACLLGLTANEPSFTKGHEMFFILYDQLVFGKACKEIEEGFYDDAMKEGMDPDTVSAEELVRLYYPGTKLREGWWTAENPRRGFYDTTKAKKLLGWTHDEQPC